MLVSSISSETYRRLVIWCGLLSAIGAAAFGLWVAPGRGVFLAIDGGLPWLCLWLLQPRFLAAPRLSGGMTAVAALTSLVGGLGLVYFGALILVGDLPAGWLAFGLVTLGVAVLACGVSRWISWAPATVAAVATAGSLAALVGLSVWASACFDCATEHYHDPPTRAFILFIWAIGGGLALSLYACTVVLFAYVARMFSQRVPA